MDRINAMRAFITVVNEGTFVAAAERLNQSPQLISKYINQLEQHLGTRLLNRTTRRVNLTEAGQRYHQRAEQLLDELDDLENQVGDLQGQVQGLLRISAPVSFATRHLAPLLCDFQQTHSAVSLDVQLNDRKVDILEEGFDIALRIGKLKSSSLVARHLAPIRLVFCAAPAYLQRHGTPQTPEDLQQHRYLRYTYMDSGDGWLKTNPRQPGSLICNNGDVLMAAALQGAGIMLQPTFIIGEAIKAGQLQVILQDHEPEPLGLYAVYAHRQLLASKVRSFIDFADGYFGNPPYWDAFANAQQD